jgi:hypothetical protein
VNATGGVFQFRVTNANLLNGLRVGQGVYANFGAKQVSLDGKSPCCTIAGTADPALLRPPVTNLRPAGTPPPVTTSAQFSPCCSVTAVSAQNLITAQNATGAPFVFSLNAPGAATMQVGQKVYANFTTSQVSLDGVSSAGAIKYLCGVPSANQVCPAGAATCRSAESNGNPGCPNGTYVTSTPATCKPGYYGPACAPCSSSCKPPNGTCSDGITGNGACQR